MSKMNKGGVFPLLAGLLLCRAVCLAGPLPFNDYLISVRKAQYQNYAGPTVPARVTKKDFAEMKAYLLTYYKGVRVERSFAGEDGVIDCVVTSTQPALHNRSDIATAPPGGQQFVSGAGDTRPACGGKSIPLRRLTLEELIRAKTLKGFLNKSPGESAPPVPRP